MTYKIHYSDYPGTDTGPPDPERWVGRTGPPGQDGEPGEMGPRGPSGGGGTPDVITYGADPSGVADSTPAFRAAFCECGGLCAGRVIHLTDQIVVGAGQVMFGDGRGGTILKVGTHFNPAATGVIFLVGREEVSPIVRDLRISFAQTTTQAVRANFRALAAGGNLTTGIIYPPAVIITSANRFKLSGLLVDGAWDGIVNSASNGSIGGYFIDNIEMGALNVGLWLDNAFDAGHIKGWHAYPFGIGGGATYTGVYLDGNTYAAKFGVHGNAQCVAIEDFFTLEGAISIDNSNSWLAFTNLGLDGNGARVEINDCQFVMITNVYSSAGPNARPQISQAGSGASFINTHFGGGWISLTSGSMTLTNISPAAQQTTIPLIRQTGGVLRLVDSYLIAPSGLGPWTTVPLVSSTGGILMLEDNLFSPMPGGSTQPGIFIATDNVAHVVQGNLLNGWAWSLPGALGYYGLNSDGISNQSVRFSRVEAKSPTGGDTGMAMVANSGQQRVLLINTGNEFNPASVRWQWIFGTNTPESGGNVGSDFLLYRYDDTGNIIGAAPACTITRSNGEFFVDRLKMNTFGLNIITPVGRQAVAGAWAGNTAGKALCVALAAFGLITDNTTP